MNRLPRLRTLDEAYREIKAVDANSCISKYFLRQLFLSGEVRTVMCGRKRLIDLDALFEYLSNPKSEPGGKGIHRVV